MTEETSAPEGGNSETQASSEVDAQLAEMHAAETAEPVAKAPAEETAEKPEVKKVVPLAALHEERRERQRLQQEIAQSRREHAEQMERINQRLAQIIPQQRGPSREEDPVGYLDQRIGQVAQTLEQQTQQHQQREQQIAQERQIVQVQTAVVQAAEAFRKEAPDLGEAVKHLNEMRTRELMALGASESEAAIQAEKELDHAAMTWAVQGRNPAQTAYEFAKARGYTPKTGQTPAEKIAAQQKGTAAAKSLGGGGAVSAGKLTAEALANMSDEDFAKLTPRQWKQAMGG